VGQGPPVLLLHGGPGLSDYLEPLADELASGYRVARYQQRGLSPSTVDGPVDVTGNVADVLAVLDHLEWESPTVIGHSWGGHLLLHVLAHHQDRVAKAMSVDGLGGVGDGGYEAFAEELNRRTPADARARVEELEEQILAGTAPADAVMEQLRLVWPGYFAEPAAALPMPEMGHSERGVEMHQSMLAELPALAARLSRVTAPVAFVHGAGSPMPVSASTQTAEAIGDTAYVEVLEGVGHFPWLERPGAVRAAVDRLVRS
jgi:pimeloyl-ACP methyl ester carboxylesterase